MDDLCFRPARVDRPTGLRIYYHERQNVCWWLKEIFIRIYFRVILKVVDGHWLRFQNLSGGQSRCVDYFAVFLNSQELSPRSLPGPTRKWIWLGAVSWRRSVVCSVIFHFTHNMLLSPYIMCADSGLHHNDINIIVIQSIDTEKVTQETFNIFMKLQCNVATATHLYPLHWKCVSTIYASIILLLSLLF